MNNKQVIEKIKGGLVVSCQAVKGEPLESSYIMSKMAYAAMLGGAQGIRANYVEDIKAIKKEVDLPVIGIIKNVIEGCDVYITPTLKEITALVEVGAEIIATDATFGSRPNGETLDEFFASAKDKYPNQLFMADVSTYEEGMHAAKIGFDFIGTTLCGYTKETKGTSLPNIELLEKLSKDSGKLVIAEGGIWTVEALSSVFKTGIHCAVMGSAITRPMEITKYFVKAIKD